MGSPSLLHAAKALQLHPVVDDASDTTLGSAIIAKGGIRRVLPTTADCLDINTAAPLQVFGEVRDVRRVWELLHRSFGTEKAERSAAKPLGS